VKLDILGVQAFVALAEHATFGKAAESLFITQTALTRRLQNLEAFLGVRLVERTTRSRSLTRVGEDFLPQARRLLGELQASLQEIRERGRSAHGEVTIACVPTIGIQYLPSVIETYTTRFPDNRIRVLDHASAGVELSVLRREAEFGIGIAPARASELAAERLLKDRFVLICRGDHPLAGRKKLAWQHLEPHRIIVPGPGSSNRPLLDAALGESPRIVRAQIEVQRSSTAVGLVAAGVGAAVVPSLAIQRGAYPSLVVLPLVDPVLTRTFVLLSRRGAALSPAAQALHDTCIDAAKRHFDGRSGIDASGPSSRA
jgi:DNA-binding transcriptional LysR family regulator